MVLGRSETVAVHRMRLKHDLHRCIWHDLLACRTALVAPPSSISPTYDLTLLATLTQCYVAGWLAVSNMRLRSLKLCHLWCRTERIVRKWAFNLVGENGVSLAISVAGHLISFNSHLQSNPPLIPWTIAFKSLIQNEWLSAVSTLMLVNFAELQL